MRLRILDCLLFLFFFLLFRGLFLFDFFLFFLFCFLLFFLFIVDNLLCPACMIDHFCLICHQKLIVITKQVVDADFYIMWESKFTSRTVSCELDAFELHVFLILIQLDEVRKFDFILIFHNDLGLPNLLVECFASTMQAVCTVVRRQWISFIRVMRFRWLLRLFDLLLLFTFFLFLFSLLLCFRFCFLLLLCLRSLWNFFTFYRKISAGYSSSNWTDSCSIKWINVTVF